MSSKQIKISDTFEKNNCGVCGCSEINQYFSLNDNFIDYNGIFYSFREILAESLDLHINHDEGKTMEICMDCKDKVIKFYHFKRKVKEIQKNRKSILSDSIRSRRNRNQENRSKLVHNIIDIVEKYTEKCSVATIRVDEDTKKLTIEPASQNQSNYESNCHHKESLLEEIPFEAQFVNMHDVSFIKQEPCFEESPSFKDDDDTMTDNTEGSQYNAKEKAGIEENFLQYFVDSSEPGPSTRNQHNISKRKLPSATSHLSRSTGTVAQGSIKDEFDKKLLKKMTNKTDAARKAFNERRRIYLQKYRQKIYQNKERYEEYKRRDAQRGREARARKKFTELT